MSALKASGNIRRASPPLQPQGVVFVLVGIALGMGATMIIVTAIGCRKTTA